MTGHRNSLPARPPLVQEKDEFTQSIIADMQRLGLRYEGITYTSGAFVYRREGACN